MFSIPENCDNDDNLKHAETYRERLLVEMAPVTSQSQFTNVHHPGSLSPFLTCTVHDRPADVT